ncbi:MAG: hypothetical protein J7K61_06530 [Thermoplasmata archaeon]|nr:hypothetical protein [Thermoplasmata archaeon]
MKLAIGIAMAGILFLYIYSTVITPYEISISDAWKYDGKEVIVQGFVKKCYGNVVEITDGNASVAVYSTKQYDYGDMIKVRGIVECGNDVIIYPDKVQVIRKWDKNVVGIEYIAENPGKFAGTKFVVSGLVYSISSSYIVISDENGIYRAKLYCRNNSYGIGEAVFIPCILNYNSHTMSFYLREV